MPVIRQLPDDPFDLVLQGDQLRAAALFAGVHAGAVPACLARLTNGAAEPYRVGVVVAGEQTYAPMVGGFPVPNVEILRGQGDGSMISANALISTPCGALIVVPLGLRLMEIDLGSAVRWLITGMTRDSTGAALGACRVVVLEVGRVQKDGAPVVAETISDGGGNYSVEVPLNVAYQVMAYKTGSPDTGGVSLNTVVPLAA